MTTNCTSWFGSAVDHEVPVVKQLRLLLGFIIGCLDVCVKSSASIDQDHLPRRDGVVMV